MTEAGARLIEAAKEAVAIAKGEQPAARIHVNGFAYVPEDRWWWQPIETAPKDGRNVMLWDADTGSHEVALWSDVYGCWLNDMTEPPRAEPRIDVVRNTVYVPTHWMPLPSPPLPSTPNVG